jgi:hypothetical protein
VVHRRLALQTIQKYEKWTKYFCIVLRHIYVSSPHLRFLHVDDPYLLDFFAAQRIPCTTNFGHCRIVDAELSRHICIVQMSRYIFARIDVTRWDDLFYRISDSFMGAEDVMNLKV